MARSRCEVNGNHDREFVRAQIKAAEADLTAAQNREPNCSDCGDMMHRQQLLFMVSDLLLQQGEDAISLLRINNQAIRTLEQRLGESGAKRYRIKIGQLELDGLPLPTLLALFYRTLYVILLLLVALRLYGWRPLEWLMDRLGG